MSKKFVVVLLSLLQNQWFLESIKKRKKNVTKNNMSLLEV